MGTLIFVALVVVVTALLLWLIFYVPMPPGSPAWIKNVLYILLVLVAIFVIVFHIGVGIPLR